MSLGLRTTKGADQQTDQCLFIRFVESIISTGKIPIFMLVSVAEETDFSLALSETPWGPII